MRINNYISIILIMLALCCASSAYTQVETKDSLYHSMDEERFDVGITGGTMLLLFGSFDVSYAISSRLTESFVLEGKAMVGWLTQWFLFEGNSSRYRMIYGGGTVGANFGRGNKFFEITLGAAYFNSPTHSWGSSSDSFLPIGSIGYKKISETGGYRVGFGMPQGIYITVYF